MFSLRVNYLPKGKIYKDSQTGEYFMVDGSGYFSESFVQYEDGTFGMNLLDGPTKFDSIDELLSAMYSYAFKKHSKKIHKDITYSKGIKV